MKNDKKAVFAGSFDPFTVGHLDVVTKAANLFEEVIVLVAGNSNKNSRFPVETRLRLALTEFAQAAQSTYQGRLFAQDALQGLRLIDLCQEVFDVVVMNPPFGALAANTKDQLVKAYPRSKNDLMAIMV